MFEGEHAIQSMLYEIILITTFCASFVQASTGFGFGILAMSVYPFLLPVPQAAALSTISSLVLSATVLYHNRRFLRLDVLWPALVSNIAVSTISIYFLSGLDSLLLTRLLGVVLILISAYFFLFGNGIKIRPTLLNGFIAGSISGFGTGMFAVGGPPLVIYLLSALDNKDEYRSSITAIFLVSGLVNTVTRAANGIITGHIMSLWAISLVAVALGTFAGNKVFRKLNEQMLRRAVYIFCGISGLTMLFK